MTARIKMVTGVLSAVLLFVLMVLTVLDVVGRNFLHRPLLGASELTEMLLPYVVFLLLPHISLHHKHITIELIDGISGRWLRRVQTILAGLTGAIVFSIIAWHLWVFGDRAVSYGDLSPSLGLPLAPVIYGISILSGLTAIAFLASLRAQPSYDSSEEAAVEEASRSAV